jgi:hypothetical protein
MLDTIIFRYHGKANRSIPYLLEWLKLNYLMMQTVDKNLKKLMVRE